MKSRLFVVLAALLFVLLAAGGCRDDNPVTPKKDTDPSLYADLTEPEHVIQNLLQSYQDRNAERFRELLKDPEYLFCLQERDVYPGGNECWNLDLDYDSTRRMFLAAMGTPEGRDPKVDRLELFLDGGGNWTDIDSIGGDACVDCQYTERIYEITLVIGETTYLGSDIVGLYVQPVDEGGVTKYKIRRMYDLPR